MKGGSFSSRLRASGYNKTNNHASALEAKVEIRARVLAMVGSPTAVFDAFAGEGQLYERVWRQADRYVGCDLTWYRDGRLMYVADSRRVMRAIDLAPFNVFDLDAWGSPWEHAAILCARRKIKPGERIGLVITEGSSLKAKMGGLPHALAMLAGVAPWIPGASGAMLNVVDRAIAEVARRLNCRMVKRWEAHGRTGARMRYIGLVLEGATADQKKAAAAPIEATAAAEA